MPGTTQIHGILEIDHDRGVIYFHAQEGKYEGASLLRICQLPRPIPRDKQLDITHMHGCDWLSGEELRRELDRQREANTKAKAVPPVPPEREREVRWGKKLIPLAEYKRRCEIMRANAAKAVITKRRKYAEWPCNRGGKKADHE